MILAWRVFANLGGLARNTRREIGLSLKVAKSQRSARILQARLSIETEKGTEQKRERDGEAPCERIILSAVSLLLHSQGIDTPWERRHPCLLASESILYSTCRPIRSQAGWKPALPGLSSRHSPEGLLIDRPFVFFDAGERIRFARR